MSVGFLRYYNSSSPKAKLRSMFAVASMYDLDFFQFEPKDINVEDKTINGLFWDKETHSYVRKVVPYPEIVDDQYNFRTKDKELFEELKQHCYLTFTGLGGKTAIYNRIKKSSFAKYVIETTYFRDMDELGIKNMAAGEAVIIKPNDGGRGENIYKLQKNADSTFTLRFEEGEKVLIFEDLKEEYFELFKTKYIVQPFIDSSTIEGNPFDIRLHLRRGHEGKWDTRLNYARIGSSSGIVSNVATGGAVAMGLNTFLKQQFGDSWRPIYNEIQQIAKTFPRVYQRNHKKLIDSFAMDVAVDRSRNNELKFFEVNTYPGMQTYPFQSSEASIPFYLHLLQLKKEGKLT
ncbi:MAG: YheC/YheD family protein [Defluviitaleaceae bacterium]|nr:YheC/YheD family protein [Defluviitaleaceae bacterium]